MAIEVTVQHRDGDQTNVTVWPVVEVLFEDEFGLPWSEAFSDKREHIPQKWLYFVAYQSVKDAGKTGLPFEDWLRTVATVTAKGEAAPDPLDQAAPAGS